MTSKRRWADADIERELKIIRKYPGALDCDVLKIGHHGSAYSPSRQLLKAASPSFALISCGKNNRYGHPSDRVIELLENSGIIYARTDQSGAVYLKRASDECLVFENAAKDRKWLIPGTRTTRSTLPRP